MLLYVTRWALTNSQFSLHRRNRPFPLIWINIPVDWWFYSLCTNSITLGQHIICVFYMLRCSSMTKFLFLTDPRPQETGIIRAMETGNTSPSLSFSPSSLWPHSTPPTFSLSLSLYFSLSPPVSLSLPPHLCHLRCAFICTDYQVQGLKSVA